MIMIHSKGAGRRIENPAALPMCDGGLEGILSLPPPGGNGLDCYNTIRSHETDASVVSAAIKCQAGLPKPLQVVAEVLPAEHAAAKLGASPD